MDIKTSRNYYQYFCTNIIQSELKLGFVTRVGIQILQPKTRQLQIKDKKRVSEFFFLNPGNLKIEVTTPGILNFHCSRNRRAAQLSPK